MTDFAALMGIPVDARIWNAVMLYMQTAAVLWGGYVQ